MAGETLLLPQVLRDRARRHGGRTALVFLADGEAEGARIDYAGLAAAAAALASRLSAAAGPGDRALLVYPPGLDFAVAFLACLEAGVVAVPAYPPRRRRQGMRGGRRLARLAADVDPRLLLTTAALRPRLEGALAETVWAGWWATDEPAAADARWRPPSLDPAAPAFLQYTSGTTGDPRGVVVSHGNLAACEEAIRRAFDQDESAVVVGWLPPYHDMGLVGTLLQPLWCGGTGVLMAPAAFLQRPRRWLEAVDRYRATTTGGPNFGYVHCLRRVPPEERRGLDLSSLTVAFSGAEPVRPDTLDDFAAAFAPCGFRRRAFFPCYGLAEATLFVTGGEVAAAPVVRDVESGKPGEPGEPARRRVGCGRAWPGETVRVVDPERRVALPAGEKGEIWVAGPAVAAGYWRRPDETAATFAARLTDGSGPYLRTGDLGVLAGDGELFVTGRAKELVIVRGRNVHPEDVEAVAAAAHPALLAAGAAAFAVEAAGEERLAVVVEIARRREAAAGEAVDAVRRAVLEDQAVAPWRVTAVRAGGLPRTTSGKVRRRACRQALLAGALPRLAEAGPGAPAAGEAQPPVVAGPVPGPVAADGRPEGSAGLADLVAAVAATVAGAAPAGVDAPLALDSLQAVEVRERVARQAGMDLPLEELLAAATPRRLAARAIPAAEPPALEPVAAGPGSAHPLSAGQRALWLVERLTPGGAGLHLAFAAAVRLAGSAPGAAAVERALAAVIARHVALRASFPTVGGEPVLRLAARPAADRSTANAAADRPAAEPAADRAAAAAADDGAAAPPAVDLAVAEAPADEAGLERAVAAAAAAAFDLERGPLVRARLWRRRGDAVLLLAVHHAVADFWSLELILAELGRELAGPAGEGRRGADAAGEDAGEVDDAAFLAFARRQERLLASPAGGALESWWRGELAAAPGALELPVDRPRPAAPSHRGSSVEVPLAPGTAAALAAVAAAAGTTPFAVLLAAWQAVLARTAGAAEVVVGCAAAGRSSEQAAAVGHFVNLLPLRGRLADDPPFGELVARAGRGLAAALEHQDLPFPRIVEVAAPRRDPARHPLVQAGLVLEAPRHLPAAGLAPFVLGAAGGRLSLGPLELVSLPLPRRAVQLEVLLTAVDASDRIVAAVDYATDLFDRATAERLARHLAALLAAAAAAPRQRLSRLAMLDDAERLQALGLGPPGTDAPGPHEPDEPGPHEPGRHGAVSPLPPPAAVPAAFLAQARRRPAAPAVLWRHGDGAVAALSYGELAACSGELAARLAAAGVRNETRVGILLGREPARVAAVLAVLAAGGCCVAIEPDEPRERIERLLRRAGAEVLITAGVAAEAAAEGRWWRLHPGAAPAGSAVETAAVGPRSRLHPGSGSAAPGVPTAAETVVGSPPGPIGEAPASPGATGAAAATVEPEAAAYVVFTSGSTGEPKGVVVPHRAIAAFAAAAAGDVAAGPGARVLHLASFAFDISLGELLLPLAAGGAVCLAAADDRRTGAALAAAVEAFGATTLIVTPSVLSLVPADRELPTLGGLVVGGEPAPPALAARWSPGRRLFNGYGPAEATVYASRRRCPAGEPERIRDLGEAVPGSRMALLGRWLEPVPPGTVGEIALSGAALARGYLGDPRTTAERFVPDPWSPIPGARLYRTGDLARRRSGGGLELVGRRDAQLKVRGVRAEPGEIEAALVRHPAVARAAVAARGERLVVWWVPENAAPPPSAAELRAFLADALPAALVPSRLLAVATLPLTATGKIDRAALVEPAAAVAAAPRGELERLLGRLWSEELGVEAVDVETTFFDLGGHSLALARVHARLVEELGREVAIADLFSHPTVAALAAHLSAAGRSTAEPPGGAGTVEIRGAGRGEARRAGLAALRRARPAAAAVRGDAATRSDE